jgi:hypothetical protein
VLVWLLLALLPAGAALALPEAELAPAIQTALNTPPLKHGVTGILIQSLRDGRTLYAQNAGMADSLRASAIDCRLPCDQRVRWRNSALGFGSPC